MDERVHYNCKKTCEVTLLKKVKIRVIAENIGRINFVMI